MDEDFYFEDHYKRNVVILIIVILLVIGGLYYGYKKYYMNNYLKVKDVTVELGSKLSDNIEEYIKCNDYSLYKLDLSNVVVDDNGNTSVAGEYSYAVIKGDEIKRGKIYVKDTTKPTVTTKDLKVGVNEVFGAFDFVESCTDLSMPCVISFKDASSADLSNKAGNYKLTIVINDGAGNKVEKDVNLIVEDGYSYKEVKANTLEVDHLSNDKADWNETYTYKFDKGLDEESTEFEETLEKYSTINLNLEKNIKDKEIIVIYNKYDYILGISIKVTYDDNTYEFITSDKIIDENTREDE